ncbi:TetR/AcrR family transcriptional regulator [Sinomonas susongensis]|uniref:TetR/AcrR family transcriptional regulator n=1 Tax=Sinomonas susongensis TaxID=1324851 RepID=UPI001485D6AA|nr:TetR/AcrR family transcriptional regulator [Sinomonas susongensis]
MNRQRGAEESVELKLYRAALELFSTKGFHNTGIREIGSHAGVSSSVLYHYLGSKEEALRELVADGLNRHAEASEAAVASLGQPEEKLAALVAVHVLVPVQHPTMSSLLQQESNLHEWPAELGQLRKRTQDLWTETLEAGKKAGVFDFGSTAVTRSGLIRSMTLVNQWYRPEGEIGLEQLVGEYWDFAFGAVRAKRGRRYLRAVHLARPTVGEILGLVRDAHDGAWW